MTPFELWIFIDRTGRFVFAVVCSVVFGVLFYHSILWGYGSEGIGSAKGVHVGSVVLVTIASIAAMFDLAMSTAKRHGPWHRVQTFAVLALVLFMVGPFEVLLMRLGLQYSSVVIVVSITTPAAIFLSIIMFSALNRRAGWKPLTDATLEKSHE